MRPFERVVSVAAPMPDGDIDTDIIFPARFLLLTEKTGLGPYAFYEKRFSSDGTERPEFVFNQPPWRGARILVAGANFGCGSSREQAPWALADLGLRCIVAPSFGEIFEGNCFNNGLLPVRVSPDHHALVLAEAQAARPMAVDLRTLRIGLEDQTEIAFEIPPRQHQALLHGWDAIDLIRHGESQHISAFERGQRQRMPWLYIE